MIPLNTNNNGQCYKYNNFHNKYNNSWFGKWLSNKSIKEQNIRFKITCKGPRLSHKMLHWELKYLMTHKPAIGNVESWQKWRTSKVITIVWLYHKKKKKPHKEEFTKIFKCFWKFTWNSLYSRKKFKPHNDNGNLKEESTC